MFSYGVLFGHTDRRRARGLDSTRVSSACALFVCVCASAPSSRRRAMGLRRRRRRRMAPIGVARGGVFFCFFFVAHSSRLAPSRDARRRCGDDIPKGISVVVPRACARRFRIVIRRLASRATALARAPRVRLRVRKPLSFVGSCLRSRRDARGDCDREGARERVDG